MLRLDKNNHFNCKVHLDDNHLDIRFTSPITQKEKISTLYEMLSIIHSLFTKHDVTYFITGGALLGVLRDNSIIPWDDDNDIGILYSDHDRIMCLNNFLPRSYKFIEPVYVQETNDSPISFQFYPNKRPIGRLLDSSYRKNFARLVCLSNGLFTDIFHYRELSSGWLTNISNSFHHTTSNNIIFPLKEYNMNGSTLYGPNKPCHFLKIQNDYADFIQKPDHHWCCLRKRWVRKFRNPILSKISRVFFDHWLYLEYDTYKQSEKKYWNKKHSFIKPNNPLNLMLWHFRRYFDDIHACYDVRFFKRKLDNSQRKQTSLQLMGYLIKLFEQNSIVDWWLDGISLLRLYKYNRLDPWNRPIDVSLIASDLPRLQMVEDSQRDQGYLLEIAPHAHFKYRNRLNPVDARLIDMEGGLFINIFVFRNVGSYLMEKCKIYNNGVRLAGHVLPPQKRLISGYEVKVPNQLKQYLIEKDGIKRNSTN